MHSLPLGHLKITPGDMDAAVAAVDEIIASDQRCYSVALNLTKYIVSKKDAKLAESINRAHQVIADGIPIAWLGRRAGYKDVHRVTGVDLSERLLGLAKQKNWSLYFLGASPQNLTKALSRIKERYDNPPIAGSRDGYFQPEDIPGIIEDINRSRPDILFLGLGMPQKEYFLHDHFDKLDVPYCITVGGAIDIWAEAKKRTPKVIQAVGLEWFVRSVYDVSKASNILKYGGIFLKDLVFYRA
jgi:N-acetylglucosaminyldiphosphoundecaprenol N-acetyl-beta-D-mannosaminyltransferase